jgi:TRAP-type C4-dicarboxylate transport system permease small subunit
VEARLLDLLGALPGPAAFVAVTGVVLLGAAAGYFAIRRSGPGRALASLFDRGLEILVAAVLLGMVFLSGLQILLRNLFDAGLHWIDPLLRHLVLLLAFTGAVLATSSKRHVQINVLGRLLRGWAGRVGGAVIAALAGTICVVLVHASLLLLGEEIEFGGEAFLGLASWMIVLVFPVAFLTIGFRFFLLCLQELAGEAPPSAEEQEAALAGAAADADASPTDAAKGVAADASPAGPPEGAGAP